MNTQQNDINQIQVIVDLLKNGSYSDINYFLKLLQTIENSAEKDWLYEAIIFALIIEIKNYEIFIEQSKQNKKNERSIMKIKILYPREDLEILAQVKKTGLNARLIRGGIAIERDFYPGEEYSLPEILLGKELRAVCCAEESGTGLSNTGHATIICSDDGSALSPVYVPSRPRMGTPQAFFEIAKGIKVKINRWHSDVTVTIISFAVSVVDCKVKYEETELWEGAPKELPDCLSQFEAAIKAGMKKASDYHCSCAHYIR